MKNQNPEGTHFPTILLALTLIKIFYQDNVINKATYEACVKRYEKYIKPEWDELEPKLRARAEQYRIQKDSEKS